MIEDETRLYSFKCNVLNFLNDTVVKNPISFLDLFDQRKEMGRIRFEQYIKCI